MDIGRESKIALVALVGVLLFGALSYLLFKGNEVAVGAVAPDVVFNQLEGRYEAAFENGEYTQILQDGTQVRSKGVIANNKRINVNIPNVTKVWNNVSNGPDGLGYVIYVQADGFVYVKGYGTERGLNEVISEAEFFTDYEGI